MFNVDPVYEVKRKENTNKQTNLKKIIRWRWKWKMKRKLFCWPTLEMAPRDKFCNFPSILLTCYGIKFSFNIYLFLLIFLLHFNFPFHFYNDISSEYTAVSNTEKNIKFISKIKMRFFFNGISFLWRLKSHKEKCYNNNKKEGKFIKITISVSLIIF